VLDGSTYVPVRFVTESLGATVKWNPSTKTATLTTRDIELDIYVSPAYNISGVDTKFRQNSAYTYEYIPYEGLQKEIYMGVKGNSYAWKVIYSYGFDKSTSYSYETETKNGLYVRSSYNSKDTLVLKYPLYPGQSWKSDSTIYTVTRTGLTYRTAVKTFDNVIELKTDDGVYGYYAANFGFIGSRVSGHDYNHTILKGLYKR